MKILYRWRRRGLQKLPAKLNKAGTLLCIEGLFLNYHATCLYLCHAQFAGFSVESTAVIDGLDVIGEKEEDLGVTMAKLPAWPAVTGGSTWMMIWGNLV